MNTYYLTTIDDDYVILNSPGSGYNSIINLVLYYYKQDVHILNCSSIFKILETDADDKFIRTILINEIPEKELIKINKLVNLL